MNILVVQNAIGELQRKLGKARDALRQIEAERYGYPEHAEPIGYEYPEGALALFLDDLQQRLMVLLDAADMRDTRASLDAAWAAFKGKSKGLSAVVHDDEFQYTYSPALSYLERVQETLLNCVDKGLSSAGATELERPRMDTRSDCSARARASRIDLRRASTSADHARLPECSIPGLRKELQHPRRPEKLRTGLWNPRIERCR